MPALQRKLLKVEPEEVEAMVSDASGGPKRAQAFAVISTASLIPTYTKTAATIRVELCPFCC